MTPPSVRQINLDEIRAARERIASTIVRTPLVRLELGSEFPDIRLKLENLQPINAYKLRGAANAVAMLSDSERQRGVWTISAGNAGQGVAYAARQAGVPCTVVAIETAPAAKLDRMRALGAKLVPGPVRSGVEEHWTTAPIPASRERSFILSMMTTSSPAMERWVWRFWKMRRRPRPSSRAIGGGGLITGVGQRDQGAATGDQDLGVEPETAAPMSLSLAAGSPQKFTNWNRFLRRRRGRAERLPADVGTDETDSRRFVSR